MNKILKEKIFRAFTSVLPITVVFLISSVVLVPMSSGTILLFLVGAALLILGIGFFTSGVEMAMRPMGEGIGVSLAKSSKLPLIILICFLIGVMILIAEPDLQILAYQVEAVIPYWYTILTVAIGVGFLLIIAVLRMLFKIKLAYLLMILYTIIFTLAFFTPGIFIPVAMESGAVATGPIVVPFILAIGLGLAIVQSNKEALDDSFGMIAVILTGPIFAMLVLGFFFEPTEIETAPIVYRDAATSVDVVRAFLTAMPKYVKDVGLAMGCIITCFTVFQIATKRFHGHQLARIIMGFIYVFLGLVFFLTGVSAGFLPAALYLGSQLAASEISLILIPLGVLIGYLIVSAEPDVYILNRQVEEITEGAIPMKMMNRGLAVGMALAMGLSMTRILFGLPLIWFLLPGYIFALVLSFFVPKIFTGIAFDSGAVCSGPISVTFLMPFAMGVAEGAGRDVMLYAIGIVAMVAMTPPVIVQIMGLIYQRKAIQAAAMTEAQEAAIAAAAGKNIDWAKITVFGRKR